MKFIVWFFIYPHWVPAVPLFGLIAWYTFLAIDNHRTFKVLRKATRYKYK